jgi:hypothetical protein
MYFHVFEKTKVQKWKNMEKHGKTWENMEKHGKT